MAHVIETLAGIAPGSPLGEAVGRRAEIFELSEASGNAVLTPREPGAISHAERSALAARMALWNGVDALAVHYRQKLQGLDASGKLSAVAKGEDIEDGDRRLKAIVRHADLVTRAPRNARRDDIEALRRAGLEEADIVRLAELIAFVNYQARVIIGLSFLKDVL
jgi:uncharacterized protein YciW